MLQVFLVAFTKQMYLINRETQELSEMGLVGRRRAGSQGTGWGAWLRPAPTGSHGAASPPPPPLWGCSAQHPSFALQADRGRSDWPGWAAGPAPEGVREGGNQGGHCVQARGCRLREGEREGEGRIPESPRPPPTSAQLPPSQAGRLKSNQTRKSCVQSGSGRRPHAGTIAAPMASGARPRGRGGTR